MLSKKWPKLLADPRMIMNSRTMDNSKRHYPISVRELHRPLLLLTVLMAGTAVVSLAGLLVDDRLITGAPAWMKPLKFSLSIMFYAITLAILNTLVHKGKRIVWWMGTVATVCAVLEMVAIIGQVVRGRGSHFNTATALDAAIFGLMGTTIVVLWLATAVVTIWLWRAELGDRALTWSIRLGMLLSLVGMAVAFMMTSPKPGQIGDGPPSTIGAHSVGVADGGPGLPLVGWSTTGGDLRVPHFIGLHALQLLPLLALGLARLARKHSRLTETVRTRLLLVASAGYTAVLALTTWQALRGESLVHPGAATLTATAAAGLVLAGATVWALRAGKPDAVTEPVDRHDVAPV